MSYPGPHPQTEHRMLLTFDQRERTFECFEFKVGLEVLVRIHLVFIPTGEAGLFELQDMVLLGQRSEEQLEFVFALGQDRFISCAVGLLGILGHLEIDTASFSEDADFAWQWKLNTLFELFGVLGPVVLGPDVQIFFTKKRKEEMRTVSISNHSRRPVLKRNRFE